VIVGGSIHAGHHQRELVEWAERHRTTLGIVPSAFFPVCHTAADDTEESRTATREYLDQFGREPSRQPVLTSAGRRTVVAGERGHRCFRACAARSTVPLRGLLRTGSVARSRWRIAAWTAG
jgi:menaquinone-dependent protoporphyrinogen IX oxidase